MSTADRQPPTNTDPGADQPRPEAPDIVNEARRIGLQPTVAYVPSTRTESAEERKKRLKRERTRQKRTEAQARGFQQINIPAVPTELVNAVKSAVAAVLEGQPGPTPEPTAPLPAPSGLQAKWHVALVITMVAVFGFFAGVVVRLL